MFDQPIYIAAIFPTIFVMLAVLGILFWRSPSNERPLILSLFLLELPMFFVSSFAIRAPFNHWFDTVVDPASLLGLFLRSFQAPLVEEPCKLWLVFLALRFSRLTADNALRVAMTIGASFGISEIWGLAWMFSHDPSTAGQPWYHFTGFIQERIMVAPIHGVFVAAAARQIVKGGRGIAIGVLSGLGLHYLANFPIFLAMLDVGHLGRPTWGIILANFTVVYTGCMYGLLIYFAIGRDRFGLLFKGFARCPECNQIYKRPSTRISIGPFQSYEKCPCCKKWHWIRWKDLEESLPATYRSPEQCAASSSDLKDRHALSNATETRANLSGN